jgi:hypothetical protein
MSAHDSIVLLMIMAIVVLTAPFTVMGAILLYEAWINVYYGLRTYLRFKKEKKLLKKYKELDIENK